MFKKKILETPQLIENSKFSGIDITKFKGHPTRAASSSKVQAYQY